MSDWRLFTGTTGLLGQYLLCEALRRREPACVLVRSRRGVSASDRMDQLISVWENRLGRVLPRPVVLDGDLRVPGLALSKTAANWLKQNVHSVVHSAASVLFQESPAGEPFQSNVVGTQNLLELCRSSAVREFHYVSTAFSCGQVDRLQPVLEELHCQSSPFGNIYEESKCVAEHIVDQAEGQFTKTIYRPSVIIGESESGYAPSFNAIYTPLRLAWAILRDSGTQIPTTDDFLEQLGFEGTGARNLVPVDWVSQAVGSIVRNPSLHGGIYHLTNPVQAEGRQVITAMVRALTASFLQEPKVKRATTKSEGLTLGGFGHHMESYKSYFEPDPIFDNSRFRAAAICPPCPLVDLESLTRAFAFAIQSRFENHETNTSIARKTPLQRDVKALLARLEKSSDTPAADGVASADTATEQSFEFVMEAAAASGFSLALSGTGGGCWRISFDLTGIRCELPDASFDKGAQFYATAEAFYAWLECKFSLDDAIRSGRLVITGNSNEVQRIPQWMSNLRSRLRPMIEPGTDPILPHPPSNDRNALAAGTKSC